MNIGYDAKRLYNNFTGLGNYSRTLVTNLKKYHPELAITLYTPKVKKNVITDGFLSNKELTTYIPSSGVKSYWRTFSIKNQLKKDRIQLYHGLSHEIPHNIHKTGIKSIVTIHDLIYLVYPKTFSYVDRSIFNYKFRYSCNNADHIVAVSESTKWDIVNYFNIDPIKIEVIYQACNRLFGKLKTKEEINTILKNYNLPSEYVLYVGSVIERKNLVTIIESYDILPESKRIPLVIVGKGKKYKKRVQDRINDLHLEKYVHWIDNMDSNDELQCLYQQASLFIYPSLYEGFGIPVIEAMINKTPVITSNTSSLPEAGGPSAWYIDPLSAEQMAYGIEKILTDTSQQEKMKEGGYNYVINTFDEKNISERLFKLYKKTLEK